MSNDVDFTGLGVTIERFGSLKLKWFCNSFNVMIITCVFNEHNIILLYFLTSKDVMVRTFSSRRYIMNGQE